MATRLYIDAPDLARSVSSAPLALRNRAALSVVRALPFHLPGITQEMNDILLRSDLAAAAKLAERLDEEYFVLDEQRDEGAVKRFAEARAAMAMKFALEGAADEALYEAIMALDDGDFVKAMFNEALRSEL